MKKPTKRKPSELVQEMRLLREEIGHLRKVCAAPSAMHMEDVLVRFGDRMHAIMKRAAAEFDAKSAQRIRADAVALLTKTLDEEEVE